MMNCDTAFIDTLETIIKGDEASFQSALFKLRCSFMDETQFLSQSSRRIPGHLEMIRDVLIACPSFACTPRASDGCYPLHIAAMIGDVHIGCVIASVVSEEYYHFK